MPEEHLVRPRMGVFHRPGVHVVQRKTVGADVLPLVERDGPHVARQLPDDTPDHRVHVGRREARPAGQRHPVAGVADRHEMEVRQVRGAREGQKVREAVDGDPDAGVPVRVQHQGPALDRVMPDPVRVRLDTGNVHAALRQWSEK